MANLPALGRFQNALEVRPLPSTGITRLPRYYGPVRLPRRPGLALAGCRLPRGGTVWGLPCCVVSPYASMPSPLPRWDRSPAVARLALRQRPSPSPCGVGSHIRFFEACSAFTRVTAYLLAGLPLQPFPSEASAVSLPPLPLRLLPAGATVAGEDSPLLKSDTFARRTRGRIYFP